MKKELRLYLVKITETENDDYKLDNEFFKEEAERQGTVFTVSGFINAWANEELPDPSDCIIKIFKEEFSL